MSNFAGFYNRSHRQDGQFTRESWSLPHSHQAPQHQSALGFKFVPNLHGFAWPSPPLSFITRPSESIQTNSLAGFPVSFSDNNLSGETNQQAGHHVEDSGPMGPPSSRPKRRKTQQSLSYSQYSDSIWKQYRSVFKELYIDQNFSLEETMKQLKENHGFNPS